MMINDVIPTEDYTVGEEVQLCAHGVCVNAIYTGGKIECLVNDYERITIPEFVTEDPLLDGLMLDAQVIRPARNPTSEFLP